MPPETLQIASTIIGIIGGILGLVSFIDNYALKFKPLINISNRLFFKFEKDSKHDILKGVTLESIILKIEIINKRTAIGRIDDFAIRVYNSNAISPQSYMLYADTILNELPASPDLLESASTVSFSATSILGKSNKNLVVEFKPEKFHTPTLNPQDSIKLELLSYISGTGWVKAPIYSPHYFRPYYETAPESGIIEYSLSDTYTIRRNAPKSLSAPKTSSYKGISESIIRHRIRRPYYFLQKIINQPLKTFKLSYNFIQLLIRSIYDSFLIWPLIKNKSKNLPYPQFSNPRAHLAQDTAKALIECKKIITELSEQINNTSDIKARITISTNDNGFTVQRANLQIKFYKSGDGYIRAEESTGYPKKYSFELRLNDYPFSIRLWKMNEKTMSLKSACIHIMDTLILVAH